MLKDNIEMIYWSIGSAENQQKKKESVITSTVCSP